MAIILGSCGCGCGDGNCKRIEDNCTFALRKFTNGADKPIVSWNEEATEADKACYEDSFSLYCYQNYGSDYQVTIEISLGLDYCTGEGTAYRIERGRTPNTDTGELEPFERTTEIGSFNAPYQDENIAWENIGELELSDEEKKLNSSSCIFSYNFSFTPDDEAEYVLISKPCQNNSYDKGVLLAADGRAYLRTTYTETVKDGVTTKACVIVNYDLIFS